MALRLGILSVIAAAMGQIALRADQPLLGFGLLVAAALVFAKALAGRSPIEPPLPSAWMSLRRERRWPGAALLGLSLISLWVVLPLFQENTSSPWAWLGFGLSLALWIAAMGLMEGFPRSGWGAARSQRALLLGIVALAAGLRLVGLEQLPFGVFYDEAFNALDARAVLAEGKFPVYFTANFGRGPFYIYGVALGFRVWGEGTVALRLPAALAGAATVLAFYWMVRSWTAPGVALAGTFLLAVSRWHINFSRIAFEAILAPLLLVLSLALLFWSFRSGRRLGVAAAGLAFGLGFYSYPGFRTLPLGVVAFFGALLWLSPARRAALQALIIFTVSAVLAAAPLFVFAQRHPDIFWGRAQDVFIFNRRDEPDLAQALLKNTAAHLAMFHYQGDHNGRHNLPGEPMLDDITGVLVVLGLAYALSQLHHPGILLLLGLGAASLLGGILSVDFEAPQALRTFGGIPIVFAMVTLGLQGMYNLLAPVRRVRASLFRWSAVAWLGASAVFNTWTYFVRQANDFAVWNAFSTAETIVARELARLGASYRAYVSPFYFGHPTIRFLAPDAEYQLWGDTQQFPLAVPPDRYAVFLDPGKELVVEEANAMYPAVQFRAISPPFGGSTVLYTATFRPEDIRSVQGLEARYLAPGEATPRVIRVDPQLSMSWPGDAPMALPFEVEWEGSLYVPESGPYLLRLRAPAEAELELDGQRMETAVNAQLYQGLHSLRLRVRGAEGNLVLAWRTPQGEEEPVPSWALYHNPVQPRGLLARYWQEKVQGPPVLERLDPFLAFYFHIPPLGTPWFVEWQGWLWAPQDGEYAIGARSRDESTIFVDGQPVVQNPGGDEQESIQFLAQGFHDLRIEYAARTHNFEFSLYWAPPGGEQEIIPSQRLFPPWSWRS